MSVTEPTSKVDKSPTQLLALLNILAMVTTLEVSQFSRDGFPCIEAAPLNMSAMSVTELVFHWLRSSEKVEAPLKSELKLVHWLVSQSAMWPTRAVISALE